MKVSHADSVIEDLISLSSYLAENDEALANRFWMRVLELFTFRRKTALSEVYENLKPNG